MKIVDDADKKIEPIFENAPKLSESSRTQVVKAWPWIAVVFGVLQVFTSIQLWHTVHPSKTYGAYYESIYGNAHPLLSGSDKFFLYLGFLMLLVNGIILLMAYPKLVKRLKAGWDLLFLGALINGLYAIISLAISGRGFISFIFSGAASIISFWLLYQVKSHYHHYRY